MLLKICNKCGNVIQYPNRYCTSCEVKAEEIRKENKLKADKKYNNKRDPKYIRFYNSTPWKILSLKYRQDKEYKCEVCGKYATETHHLIPIQVEEGWNRRLDYTNLQCLCIECHNKIHRRFQHKKRRR